MKRIWTYITFLCLFFLPQNSYPSAEKFKLLDMDDGLFNNQVRFLTQMEDGRILVYTEGMFNVYDGNRFEPLDCDLSNTLPLGMHNICMAYDGGNGLLWATSGKPSISGSISRQTSGNGCALAVSPAVMPCIWVLK